MTILVNDPLIVMSFPIKDRENFDRDEIVKAVIERKADILSTFRNNEFLKLDLTHQEIIGLKSTTMAGNIPITDLPALNHVVDRTEKYKESKIINLGNVNTIYDHYCS